MNQEFKNKVIVAMSGGVDSTTVAAILHKKKYQVIGITLQLYNNNTLKKNSCCTGKDIYDAKIAANQIGIPHYTLNYEKTFKEKIIDNFTTSYIKGETPIPCISCNQKIKFDDLYNIAKKLGAIALATGHYVKKSILEKKYILKKGEDEKKDQSYFFFTITKQQLKFLEFPLGNCTKKETRNLAKTFQLSIAKKSESQDICFVSNNHYSNIIKNLYPELNSNKGDIINSNGKILGKHHGTYNFTIGQRKGIKISYLEPLYIIDIDSMNKRIIVGNKKDLKIKIFNIKATNLLSNKYIIDKYIICKIKLHSNHKEKKGLITYLGNSIGKIILDTYYSGIAAGQACVIYYKNILLGGGWIIKNF